MARTFTVSQQMANSSKLYNPPTRSFRGIRPVRYNSPQQHRRRLDVRPIKVNLHHTHILSVNMPHLRVGFEGLTLDHKNQVLYAMLQSAAVQDGGDKKSTSRFTRMIAYDVSNPSVQPTLVGEWVVPLPLSSKGNTQASSELHFVSPGVFLALARDGDGRGGDDNNTKYKLVFVIQQRYIYLFEPF